MRPRAQRLLLSEGLQKESDTCTKLSRAATDTLRAADSLKQTNLRALHNDIREEVILRYYVLRLLLFAPALPNRCTCDLFLACILPTASGLSWAQVPRHRHALKLCQRARTPSTSLGWSNTAVRCVPNISHRCSARTVSRLWPHVHVPSGHRRLYHCVAL